MLDRQHRICNNARDMESRGQNYAHLLRTLIFWSFTYKYSHRRPKSIGSNSHALQSWCNPDRRKLEIRCLHLLCTFLLSSVRKEPNKTKDHYRQFLYLTKQMSIPLGRMTQRFGEYMFGGSATRPEWIPQGTCPTGTRKGKLNASGTQGCDTGNANYQETECPRRSAY